MAQALEELPLALLTYKPGRNYLTSVTFELENEESALSRALAATEDRIDGLRMRYDG
jgi:hypothetical protein